MDEDPIDLTDNDADTLIDEDDVVAYVTFRVSTLLEPKDEHVGDDDLSQPGCDPADPATWPLCGNNYGSSTITVMVSPPQSDVKIIDQSLWDSLPTRPSTIV